MKVSSNDLAELIFTSGTTRKPKAVMLTHANCLRAGLDAVHCLWLDDGERCLTALPLFHVNAQAMSLFGTLTVAGTLVVIQEFRASKLWGAGAPPPRHPDLPGGDAVAHDPRPAAGRGRA